MIQPGGADASQLNKAGASLDMGLPMSASPAVTPAPGRISTPVLCALRVPGYRPFPFAAQFISFSAGSHLTDGAGARFHSRAPGAANVQSPFHDTISTPKGSRDHAF